MSANDAVYHKLLESIPLDPERILRFKFPPAAQKRMKKLVELSRRGRLTEAQSTEIERYLAAEALIRVLKAKAFAAQRVRK